LSRSLPSSRLALGGRMPGRSLPALFLSAGFPFLRCALGLVSPDTAVPACLMACLPVGGGPGVGRSGSCTQGFLRAPCGLGVSLCPLPCTFPLVLGSPLPGSSCPTVVGGLFGYTSSCAHFAWLSGAVQSERRALFGPRPAFWFVCCGRSGLGHGGLVVV
jgi:hypothetical protein